MLYHSIRQIFRNLLHQRIYYFINILGLAAGFASAFFVLLFILNELDWDKHHKNRDLIYRILAYDRIHKWLHAATPFPLAAALAEDCPEVNKVTHITRISRINVEKDDQWIEEEFFYSADTSILGIFTFPLVNGNPETVLSQPRSLIITESVAQKYFSEQDPVNKILKVRIKNEVTELRVTGIMKDPPLHITFRPGFIASIDFGLEALTKTLITVGGEPPGVQDLLFAWNMPFFETYLLLKQSASPSKAGNAFRIIEQKHLGEEPVYTFDLQPLNDIYLGSADLINSDTVSGNRQVIYIFSVIAFLIILVSALNYILLYSSQTMVRSKEFGVRKVFGASRSNLLKQILTETMFIAFLVLPVALYLVEQFRPWLSNFLGKPIVIDYPLSLQYPIGFLTATILVGLIPGIVIISYVSKIQPVQAIESSKKSHKGQSYLRFTLAFGQFVIFYLLLINSIGIYKQIRFTQEKDLGFDWQNLLVISLDQQNMPDYFNVLKNEFVRNPDILSISGAMWIPPSGSKMSVNLQKLNGSGEHVNIEALFVEKDFLETMEINLVEGRSLSEFDGEDPWKIVINEKALELLGTDDYIGAKLMQGEIIGRIENIHTHSLHEETPPLMIISVASQVRNMVVRYRDNTGQVTQDYINREIKRLIPGSSPEILFIEDIFHEMYQDERRTASIVAFFTIITMCLCTMGLFGMSMYTLQRRTREFAIRKVNGAGMADIFNLVTGKYVVFVLLSLLVASPFAYLLLRQWLQNFVYKTAISWWIFLLSGTITFVIVFIAIGYHVIRATRTNPADNLRYQ